MNSLTKNTIFNFSGQAIVLCIAILAIPLMIRGMGTERFGVLALIWSFIGYFNLFDLGLGRALTTFVARGLCSDPTEIPQLIWTGLGLQILLGIGGALTITATAPWLINETLKIPPAIQEESLTAIYSIAAIFPFVITNTGFRGILEGLQRFDVVNAVNIGFGIFSFAGSLLVLLFSTHLGALVAVVIVGRLMAWIISLFFCFKLIPNLKNWKLPEPVISRKLLGFGGWMSVTNVIGPLMVTFDRFLIGVWLSVTAVAYYTTPHDVITKMSIIPGALVSALFPVFSASHMDYPDQNRRLLNLAVKYIFIVLFPLTLLIVAFSREGLTFWLGDEFAAQSATVLQWLAAGVLINSLAHVPFALIQGSGRPDLTAKMHLFELPLYLVCLFYLVNHFGITGAAIAWTLRVSLDSILLFILAWNLLLKKSIVGSPLIIAILTSLLSFLLISVITSSIIRLIVFLIILVAFALYSFHYLLLHNERMYLLDTFNALRNKK